MITITCRNKYCKQTTPTHNTHYLVTKGPKLTNSNPIHCPMCQATEHFISIRPVDYADTLCQQYNMPRKLAVFCIEQFNNQQTTTTKQYTNDSGITQTQVKSKALQYKCVEDLIMATMPVKPSNGTCPLNVQCHDCLATVTVIRTRPTYTAPPSYCIWCGSNHITVTQANGNEIIDLETLTFESIATRYSIPVKLVTHFYAEWERQAQIKSFNDFLHHPDVQQIITHVQTR